MATQFYKMHGLGNDFVIIDGRNGSLAMTPRGAAAIADRRRGVGADQVIILEAPQDPAAADVAMRILNADGSTAQACGNATRAVARLIGAEIDRPRLVVETVAGLLECEMHDDGDITVDMGEPRTGWEDIPLSRPVEDTLHLPLAVGELADPAAVSIGNPHCVFFVDDAENAPVERMGPLIEHHQLFPERTNVEFVEVKARDRLRVRVWERGSGLTLACGSGAVASAYAAHARGLAGEHVVVEMDGGVLTLDIREGRILMTGPAVLAFTGVLADGILAGAPENTSART